MTTLRVTQRSIAQQTLAGLQGNIGRLGEIQQRLSSGKEISKPSDSPTGTVSAMQLRSEIRSNEQWSRNADDGIGWLGTMDQTLGSSLDSLQKIRGLTLQALNSGASSPESDQARAVEVVQLREGLIGLANTTYLERPVFGGTTNGRRAYDATGTYVGNPRQPVPPATALPVVPVTRTVGAGAEVRVDQTGPEVYGPAGADLFTVLAGITQHMKDGNTAALTSDLTDLDTAMSRMQGKLAEVGASYNRVEQMHQAADDRVLALKSSLSGIEDIDLPKTIVELQMQQVVYQAALGATAKIITPSLADFLR
jgi:flagellar hook-associated protein 3 FlgL